MAGKKKDSTTWAPKMASLVVAWAIIGFIAYFGIIKQMVNLLEKIIPQWTGPNLESGIVGLHYDKIKGVPVTYDIAIKALVVGLLVLLFAGIVSRARPGFAWANGLAVAASVVCLLSASVLFAGAVFNQQNGVEFLVALGTIVAVWILVRVQRFIRRFYSTSPAFVSLLAVILTLAYIIFGQGVNITSIIVSQLDIWLVLVASAVALYASLNLARHGNRARKAP